MRKFNVILVDDHLLFSNSLKKLIDSFEDYQVGGQLKNGKALITHLRYNNEPVDLILLDVKMPVMGGLETIKWLKENHPYLKVLVLSMDDNDETIIAMLRYGAKGYILKDIDPLEFRNALNEVIHKGFYHSEKVGSALLQEIISDNSASNKYQLKEKEKEFLNLACTERTYKEIASDMFLSPKTIDGYRESLFKKLGVKSRVGLVLFAIKNELVTI